MEISRSNCSLNSGEEDLPSLKPIQEEPQVTKVNPSSDDPRPSVRAIIQKYEPNPTPSPKGVYSPRTFKVNSPAKPYNTKTNNAYSGTNQYNAPQNGRKSVGSFDLKETLIVNDIGTYSAKLVNKEVISNHSLSDEHNIEDFQTDLSGNTTPKSPESTKRETFNSSYIVSSYRSNNDNLLSEKSSHTNICQKNSSKDKCVGTNVVTASQEIQPNGLKNGNISDTSYQSKTTISKTPNGVRIITDIFFDSHVDPNWKGSRIETDIPPSRILKEFQDKNTERK